MIAFLQGTIDEVTPDSVVLDVGGVGFLVQVSGETASRLSSMGSGAPVKIYTYTYVREDALNLYGFLSRDELALYKSLITVSGIGPKGGLALLSGMSADDLRFAIITGDVKAISKAPGIGKKTAERLVLDLRDKLGSADDLIRPAGVRMPDADGEGGAEGPEADAAAALTALGYSRPEAVKAVRSAAEEGETDTEGLLKAALKFLL